jgi:hypothetical protein
MAKKHQQKKRNQQNGKLAEMDPFYKLPDHKRAAVEMRIRLYRYEEISLFLEKKLKHKAAEQTVRTWFMKGGDCYEALEYRRKILFEENKEELKSVNERFDLLIAKAINVLDRKLDRNSENAALKTLEMRGYGATLKIKDETERKDPINELRDILTNIQHDRKKRTARSARNTKRKLQDK